LYDLEQQFACKKKENETLRAKYGIEKTKLYNYSILFTEKLFFPDLVKQHIEDNKAVA